MASPLAQVQVSINSGGWQSGGILSVPFSATVNFQNATSAGIRSYSWALLDYPPGLTLPAGWQDINGIYTYTGGATPPTITLPASGVNNWGKIPIVLSLNGNPFQYDDTGALNPAYNPSLTDSATILSIASPNKGMQGIRFTEATQFDSLRSWVGAIMDMARKCD